MGSFRKDRYRTGSIQWTGATTRSWEHKKIMATYPFMGKNNSSSPSHSANRIHTSATTNIDGRRGLAQIDCKLKLEGGRVAQSHARRGLTHSALCQFRMMNWQQFQSITILSFAKLCCRSWNRDEA